ncbi:UPF0488 protein C8orf33-like protein [Acropora cervicornis]|uniref:UPF0488 protein C8orf33-like protein n=1 Tax=Acropora cervicornis TaxID=6130 RepID=A0AAD9V0E1_ACRCE|nr:UPF0488 protein C8orf33-like protein [Acropora cervicornis]
MADGERFENQKELSAKQRKNKKKREAAKLKNQEKKSAFENDDVPIEKVPETRLENDEEKEQESIENKFHRELNWCIEQLEMGLAFKKPDKKQAQIVQHHVRSLKSSKTPLPRKRQIMFSLFGDYRKKMQEDQKKQIEVCQAKIPDLNAQRGKDTVVGTNYWQFQKSDNSFLFDFDNEEPT